MVGRVSGWVGGWLEDWRVMLNSTQDQIKLKLKFVLSLAKVGYCLIIIADGLFFVYFDPIILELVIKELRSIDTPVYNVEDKKEDRDHNLAPPLHVFDQADCVPLHILE